MAAGLGEPTVGAGGDGALLAPGADGTLLGPLAVGEQPESTAAAPRFRSVPLPTATRPGRLELDVAAIVLGVLVGFRGQTHTSLLTAVLLLAGFPIAALWLLGRRPATWEDGSLLDELRRVVAATSMSALALIGTDAIVDSTPGVALGLRIWLCTLALLVTARSVLRRVCARMPQAGGRPTLIVGAGRVGAELARHLRAEPRHGLRPLGFLEYASGPRGWDAGDAPGGVGANGASRDLPLLGTPDELGTAIAQTQAVCVAFAFPLGSDERLLPLVQQCERLGVRTLVVPRLFEALGWRMQLRQVGSLPVSELAPIAPGDVRFAVKHIVDRVAAALLLLALAPLMLGIALLVKFSSSGPVFFRQRRIGRDEREFTMLKFRTMHQPLAGSGQFEPPTGCAPGGVEDEDRRTRLGCWLRRSSLDEVPQLINVLRGEMTLIGPRPERPEYVRRFGAELRLYDRRHRVKSGITGLAQVSGLRGQTSIVERAEYDNFYVQNWSFWLDFKIALRTMKIVLALRGE